MNLSFLVTIRMNGNIALLMIFSGLIELRTENGLIGIRTEFGLIGLGPNPA